MNFAVKWAQVNRLRAVIGNSEPISYPQATSDVRATIELLEHYRSDAEFLRIEKERAWRFVNSPDQPERGERIALTVLAAILIILAILVVILGWRIGP